MTIENPTFGSVATSAELVTVQQTVAGLTIEPTASKVAAGTTVQLSAVEIDQFGNAIGPSGDAVWSIGSGAGTVNQQVRSTAPSSSVTITVVVEASSGAGDWLPGVSGNALALTGGQVELPNGIVNGSRIGRAKWRLGSTLRAAQLCGPARLAPGATITQSAGGLDVVEGGVADSYQIALDDFPTATVTVTIDPDTQTDLGAGAGVAVDLVFTPADAIIPQTVTVVAVDDDDFEGDHASVVTHTATSSDQRYDGLAIANVVASVEDNETIPVPSIVISELMYDPASDESSPGVAEWIEVVNTGGSEADLSGWRFDDEDSTDWGAIPQGTLLGVGQVALFYDAAFTTESAFRSAWAVPAGALVVGVDWGNLANTPSEMSEVLELLDDQGALQDVVNYDDTSPWPSNNNRASIYLTDLSADNNEGANWARSVDGVDRGTAPSGPLFSSDDMGSPGRTPNLAGDYNQDGIVNAADYTVWRNIVGGSVLLNEVATFGVVDRPD